MGRHLVTLRRTADRERAQRLVAAAPFGSRVEVKAARRSLPQNDKMWAMLTEVAQQLPWHGQRLRPDDYKLIFLAALKREARFVPDLEGTGLVDISGTSSSDLTKDEMSNLLELIAAFGTEHGVKFNDAVAA